MNKKNVLLTMLVAFSLVVVSAALVNWLSNTSNATVTVSSPYEVSMSADGVSYQETGVIIPSVYGGETFKVFAKVTNLANVSSNVNIEVKIVSDDPTCDDFTNVLIEGDKSSSTIYSGPLTSAVCTKDGNTLTMLIPAYYTAHETEVYETDWTFALNVMPANYTFNVKVVI